MPTITDNFEEENSKYAVITTKVNKDYPKISSSLKEKKKSLAIDARHPFQRE